MQEERTQQFSATKIFLIIFLPFTLGYFLTAFFNQVNAVIAPFDE